MWAKVGNEATMNKEILYNISGESYPVSVNSFLTASEYIRNLWNKW